MERIAETHGRFQSTPPCLPATLMPHGSLPCHEAMAIAELGPILIASPHPDDETLGCGGLIARCARLGCPITVLAVTNGEASHPGDRTWQERLAATRSQEQRNALKVLGLTNPDIVPLALPDGGLEDFNEEQLRKVLDQVLNIVQDRGIETLVVPAVDDCHGDHRVTARVLAKAALVHPVRHFLSYQIWPPEVRLSHVSASECAYAHDISDLVGLKRDAVYQHRSQLDAIDADHTEGFRMPDSLLGNKLKTSETFALVHDIATWSGLPEQNQ